MKYRGHYFPPVVKIRRGFALTRKKQKRSLILHGLMGCAHFKSPPTGGYELIIPPVVNANRCALDHLK